MRDMVIQYGRKRIEFQLSYSPRKTLAIDVHPDLSVAVTAPKDATDFAVEDKMQKRASWIIQQQRFFENYLPSIPARKYVSGESHRYLGRQYRLRVHEGDEDIVKMARGQINVYLTNSTKKGRIKTLVVGWFRQRAEVVFSRTARCDGGKGRTPRHLSGQLRHPPHEEPLGKLYRGRANPTQSRSDHRSKDVHRVRDRPRTLPP